MYYASFYVSNVCTALIFSLKFSPTHDSQFELIKIIILNTTYIRTCGITREIFEMKLFDVKLLEL